MTIRDGHDGHGAMSWLEDQVWGAGRLLGTVSPTEGRRYYAADHLGTPRLACDRCQKTKAQHADLQGTLIYRSAGKHPDAVSRWARRAAIRRLENPSLAEQHEALDRKIAARVSSASDFEEGMVDNV